MTVPIYKGRTHFIVIAILLFDLWLASGCNPVPATALITEVPASLTNQQVETLASLIKVDAYPLYTLHYVGEYAEVAQAAPRPTAGACSLFAALGNSQSRLYGRNFDWHYSPATLLFSDPPEGYASVSMVDIAYLFPNAKTARSLEELPLKERIALLDTWQMPFDGMNEYGLAVGMSAVSDSMTPNDPAKATMDSLQVMRQVLDRARTVDEAVEILGSYNIDWIGGPQVHYLVADEDGGAALIEYYEREMVVFQNEQLWLQATNFTVAAQNGSPLGVCPRYDRIHARLSQTNGSLTPVEALDLLEQVASSDKAFGTQWSVVYDLSARRVQVVMGREYGNVYEFKVGEE